MESRMGAAQCTTLAKLSTIAIGIAHWAIVDTA